VAIALTAVLGIIFVLLRTFEQLADTFVTAILPFYALGVASIFVFRRRTTAEYSPPFRAPLYPVAPILFVLATIYLLVNALIDPSSRWPTLSIFLVILVGIPIYYATVGRSGTRAAGEGRRATDDRGPTIDDRRPATDSGMAERRTGESLPLEHR
jgi:L-asparagine transporter-like permease